MEDKTDKAVKDIESTAELTPIIDGVKAIANDVKSTRDKVDAKLTEIETKVDRTTEDFRNEMNKGLENVLERVDRQGRAHSAAVQAALHIEPAKDSLREVISKDVRGNARAFEVAAKSLGRVSSEKLEISDPETYMASHEWFYHASRAQHRKYAGRAAYHAEQADKIRTAMEDFAGVTKANPLQEDTDGEGGYLVPTIVEADVMRLITDAAKLWPMCRQLQMNSKIHNVPNEATAVTVNWIAEEGTLTGGEPVFGQTVIQADKLAGRATLSLELLQDSNVGLLPWLLSVFTEKMAGQLDFQLLLGDGTLPELLGVMNATNVNAVTDSTRTSLTWTKIVQAFTGATEQSARDDGVWCMSKNGFAECLKLVDSNGVPLIQYPDRGGGPREAPFGTILGRPVLVSSYWTGSETLDNTTAATQKTNLIFGPPSTIVAGTRLGMSWEVTDQVNWQFYQADARLVGRFGARPGVEAAWTYATIKYS